MSNANKKQRVIDDPDAVEVYVNKVVNVAFDGGGIILTLGVQRCTPEEIGEAPTTAPAVVVKVRVAIPPPAAGEMINSINTVMATAAAAQAAATSPLVKKN